VTLKPCPFCGNKTPRIVRAGTARYSTQIECGNCGCRHESGDEGTEVGQSWNERAVLQEVPA
jgi:Lar family restriction alleviation protein